jgi:hypothetical protein
MTIAATPEIRKPPDRLGLPLGLLKHKSIALKSAFY